jgi:hypothetical protein
VKIIDLAKKLFAAALLAVAASAPAHATLTGTVHGLYFSGTCTDCTGTVRAYLSFDEYTIGTPLQRANFYGFSYSGSNLLAPYSIEGDGDPTTVLSTTVIKPSGHGSFRIHDDKHFFTVNLDGSWETGIYTPPTPCTSNCGGGGSGHYQQQDFGTGGIFSDVAFPPLQPPVVPADPNDVPEPGSAFLLFLGFSAMAAVHRKRRATRRT